MNKHQDFFSRTQGNGNPSGGFLKNGKQSSNTGVRILMVLCLIIGGTIGTYFYASDLVFQETQINHQTTLPTYSIGEQVQVEGTLKEESTDLITYTHTLTTSQGELFYLKSKKLPLNNYTTSLSGVFQIIGKVEALVQEIPLLEVEDIGIATTEKNPDILSGTINTEPVNNPGIYLSRLGLYFGQDFLDNYAFVGQAGENNKIIIKNLENEKLITIEAFSCTENGDTNCKELSRTFNDSSEKSTTNQDSITFYKLSEVSTWFFQNNNRRGYFINNSEDQEVEKLIPLLRFPSPEAIKQIVNLHGVKTCLGTDNGLNKITAHTSKKTINGIELNLQGNGEKEFSCQTIIDLTQQNKMRFIDLKIRENVLQTGGRIEINTTGSSLANPPTQHITTPTQEKKEEKSDTLPPKQQVISDQTSFNPNVAQFPINLDKTLTYKSARGNYTMTFPSSNIAYGASNSENPLSNYGVKCNYLINLVQYKNKDLLESDPTLTIYECSNKNQLSGAPENYLVKELEDKQFVIAVHDGSWLNFAKNIEIKSL